MTTSFAPWRARSERSMRVLAQRAQARGHGRVVDGDHAALAGGDHLARVEREAGQRAERADRAALVGAPMAQAASSTSASPWRSASGDEGVHVGRQAELVHRHDRLRALGDRALGRGGVEVVGQRVDVGEDRRRAALPDRVGRGDERQRRHDDLVAGADAGDVEREVQRGGAVGRRHGVGRADALGEGRLELGDPRALGDPAGGDDRRRRPRRPPRQRRARERDLHQDAFASGGRRASARRARRATTRPAA